MIIQMNINAEGCPICKKPMIIKAPNGIYPYGYDRTQNAQMKLLKLVYQSDIKVDDEYICVECVKSGRADFLCALCGNRKSTDKEKEAFGDPEEYLCIDCYDIVPAKEWDMEVKRLHDSHRWDYD